MKALLKKHKNAFYPADEYSEEIVNKFRDGEEVQVDLSKTRNPRQLKLYWAMIRFIQEHCDIFMGRDEEIIHASLKIATGLVSIFIDEVSGKTVLVPKSISMNSMGQERFDKFFKAACHTISERWMPAGTTAESIRNELLAKIDGH